MKNSIMILSGMALICYSLTASTHGLADTVLHYNFNEDDDGDAVDQSGWGNNGEIFGATYVPTDCGGLYEFNGVSDHIRIPESPSLTLTGSMSVAVWFNVHDYQRQRPIVEWNRSEGSVGAGPHVWVGTWGYQWQGKGAGANLIDTSGDDISYVISTANPPPNEWHHMVVTYDQASGIADLYLNSKRVRQRNIGSIVPRTDSDVYIGTRPGLAHDLFWGQIADIRIFNQALSSNEVRALFTDTTNCVPVVGKIKGLIEPMAARAEGAKWRLAHGPNTNWNDSGATLLNIPQGDYVITFSDLPGWNTPSDMNVSVPAGETSSATGVYTASDGGTNTLVLYYDFNANDGDVVHDLSGYNNHGTVMGAKFMETICGGVYEFNGIADHILVPTSSSLALSNSLSMAAWFRVYNYAMQRPILEWTDNITSLIGVHLWTGTQGFQWQGKGTGANLIDITQNEISYVISTANPQANQWHHLAVTYDRPTGNARVYVDGILKDEKNIGVFTPHTLGDLTIGMRHSATNARFYGLLDEIRVYKGVISSNEVYDLFLSYEHCQGDVGSITCTILPEQSIAAGAKWRITSGPFTQWNNSGAVVANLPLGSYTVEFAPLTGWTTPGNLAVEVTGGELIATNATYDVAEPTPRTLVLHYPFDNDDGDTATDMSGYGNHGALTGGTFTPTDAGGVMHLDGSNDFIFIQASESLNVAGSLTLAAWFKTDSYTYQRPILEWNNGEGRSGVHMWTGTWGYQWQGKGTGANLIDIAGNEISYVISTANPKTGIWHHLAVTYDRDIGKARVYLNGALAGEKAIGIINPQTGYDVYIGRRPGMALHGFQGELDDIRVYAGALTASEVGGLFAGEGGETPPAASVTCTIEPVGARNAGARWRLASDINNQWRESGATLTGLEPHTSSITFSDLSGWITPADMPVTLSQGSNTQIVAAYLLDEIDDIPPVIISIRPPDGSVGLAHSAAMVVTVTDNVEVVRVTVNGHEAHTSNGRIWNFQITGIRGSYNLVQVIAADRAGNQTIHTINYAHSSRITLASMWDGFWRVANPFTNDVDYTWDVVGSSEEGAGTAPAGSHHYFTTSPGPKAVRLFVDGNLVDVSHSYLAPPQPEGLFSGSLDSDNDGMSNFDKEIAGLSINDPNSRFELSAALTEQDNGASVQSGQIVFGSPEYAGFQQIVYTWQSGVDSIYTIEGTTDLVHWFPMPDFVNVPGTGATMTYTNQNHSLRILMLRLKAEKMP